MKAAEFAGVKRFVLVSYASAEPDIERVSTEDPFHPYLKAKTAADKALEQSLLDYTILGPGVLMLEPASGQIRRAEPARHVLEGRERADADGKVTSRENVAEVIAMWSRTRWVSAAGSTSTTVRPRSLRPSVKETKPRSGSCRIPYFRGAPATGDTPGASWRKSRQVTPS